MQLKKQLCKESKGRIDTKNSYAAYLKLTVTVNSDLIFPLCYSFVDVPMGRETPKQSDLHPQTVIVEKSARCWAVK